MPEQRRPMLDGLISVPRRSRAGAVERSLALAENSMTDAMGTIVGRGPVVIRLGPASAEPRETITVSTASGRR